MISVAKAIKYKSPKVRQKETDARVARCKLKTDEQRMNKGKRMLNLKNGNPTIINLSMNY